jgi:hypothetical protein
VSFFCGVNDWSKKCSDETAAMKVFLGRSTTSE